MPDETSVDFQYITNRCTYTPVLIRTAGVQ